MRSFINRQVVSDTGQISVTRRSPTASIGSLRESSAAFAFFLELPQYQKPDGRNDRALPIARTAYSSWSPHALQPDAIGLPTVPEEKRQTQDWRNEFPNVSKYFPKPVDAFLRYLLVFPLFLRHLHVEPRFRIIAIATIARSKTMTTSPHVETAGALLLGRDCTRLAANPVPDGL